VPCLAELGLAGDAMSDPLSYPGTVPDRAALIDGDKLTWVPDQTSRADLLSGRQPVVAVGSSRSPGQLARKFRRAGVGNRILMIPATIGWIAIGHSAHVSRWGYIAAAPFVTNSPDVTPVTVVGLDGPQLAALDRTEANYDRVSVDGGRFPVTLDTGECLDSYALYSSRWGVLRSAEGPPYPLQPQARLLADLLGRSAELAMLLGPDPAAFAQLAAQDAGRRAAATRLFARSGWAGDPGLG
jgi:hypothetical protein